MSRAHSPGADAITRLDDAAQAAQWLAAQLAAAGGQGRLVIDSRLLQPGDAFIAWPGAATDGRRFVADALAAGAAACLVEADGCEAYAWRDARVAALPGLKAAAGEVAAAVHGHPARALQVLAVTGTNGKSSCAWWTAQALSLLGRPCEVVGTLGIGRVPMAADAGTLVGTGLTTPDPVTLQAAFARMQREGVQACAIEASSIGLAEHRLAAVPVTVAQFTNFTRDHLDYHGDMAAYWRAKRALFDKPGLRAAVVNIDDAQGQALARELAGSRLDLWSTSLQPGARLSAEDLRYVFGGLAFTAVERLDGREGGGSRRVPVRSTLIGDYNAHNLLTVLAGLRALGVPLDAAASVVPRLSAVPGRLERVSAGAEAQQPEVVVDYAHTPDALEQVLGALRPLAHSRGGRLWCVFGCGGNRDASKRPLMGAIAQRLADRVVLTSDNPRLEDPQQILAQIAAGLSAPPDPSAAAQTIVDRRQAIHQAIAQAAPADVLLLAGKGHEDYQDIGGVKLPFLDAAVAAAALAARGAA